MSDDNRWVNVWIYVIGTLMELKEKGLVEGDGYQLTMNGVVEFKKLKDSNFRPTEEEVGVAVGILKRQ